MTYYSVLIAWTTRALFESGSPNAPWNQANLTSSMATEYFNNEVIGMETLVEEDGNVPTRLIGTNVGYSLLIFVLVVLCLFKGVETTGKVTYLTMGTPIVLLFTFLILDCTLEGSFIGIKAYIGEWDLSVLTKRGDVWSTAVSQIFYSIGIGFGVLASYGSHMPRDENTFKNSCVIAISNSIFSIVAGFAVFAAIGNETFIQGKEVSELDNISTFGLVFGTWPLVLSRLPGGIHWVRLFFLFLIFLGIDSLFAGQEGTITCITDMKKFRTDSQWKITVFVVLVSWLFSCIYCTDGGLNFLDVIDFYINFILIFIGFFESFAIGWVYDIENQMERFGKIVVFTHIVANFGAVLLASCIWFGLKSIWGGFVAFGGFYMLFMIITIILVNNRKSEISQDSTLGELMHDLVLGNILGFKKEIEPFVTQVPTSWCYVIKFFVPHVLLILFINLALSKTSNGLPTFGNYGEYVALPYQVLGVLTFAFVAALLLIGLFFPGVYEVLDTRHEIEEDSHREDSL